MKNTLAIEIKDNKTIITLTKLINGKHNLMFHKSYDSKALKSSSSYDETIIDKIKNDLTDNGLIFDVDERYLTINTKKTIIQTFDTEIKNSYNEKKEKETLTKELENKYPKLKIVSLELANSITGVSKRKIVATVEFVEREYLNKIVRLFKFADMPIKKIIPAISAIKNSTTANEIKRGITFSILVEEKFTQLTAVKNGKVSYSVKWNSGLNNIYEHISSAMSIDKSSAKKLFKSFGSIPPEDVVDNKVVHCVKHQKEIVVFTKRDVSRFITEKVNEIFSNVKSQVDSMKRENNVKIIFNGEIKSLVGFKKYATKSFAEKNIEQFNTKIIGLNNETEFITMGILMGIEKEKTYGLKKLNENVPRIKAINKFIRIYNYI